MFGNAEQLNLSASIINWGGSDTTGLGYELGAQLNKPDFGRPDQSLQFNLTRPQAGSDRLRSDRADRRGDA